MRRIMGIATSVLLTLSAGSAMAEPLEFTLINSTGYVITQLQISPLSMNHWGENILGTDVILQGETATVTIADGRTSCEYDMLITFNDGNTIEERNYDFCDLASYEATD